MATIPTLLLLGNRFFIALLREAQLALGEEDWACALDRVREFEYHMSRHRKAESEVLYPRLASLNLALEAELLQLCQEYAEIAALTEIALRGVAERDKDRSEPIIGQLIDLVSFHWMAQQHLIYFVAQQADEQVLIELAERLGVAGDNPELTFGQSGRPIGTRLH